MPPLDRHAAIEILESLDTAPLVRDVVSRITEDASPGCLLAVTFAAESGLEDIESLDPSDPEHRDAFEAFAAATAEHQVSEALDTLCEAIRVEDDGIRVWRELAVPRGWESEGVFGRPLGVYWAYDREGAEAHWAQGLGDEGAGYVVVEGRVDPDGVDWAETVALNAAAEHTVGEEREVRLRLDALVRIVGMTWRDKPGSVPVPLDVSHLAETVFPVGEPPEALHDPEYYDRHHNAASSGSGFFGAQGSGCIVVARSTGRILWPLRSRAVMQPGTYGTWGGALDPGLTPAQGALRELRQEAGYDGPVELTPLLVFKPEGSTFRYHNLLAVVEDEFEPELNHETDSAEWLEFGNWPDPLHFGAKALLEDAASYEAIEQACRISAPRP